MLKPFKIRVKNEQHSREIQEYLFEHGVPWYGGGTSVINTDKPFLLVYQAPYHWNAYIAYIEEEKLFNYKPLPEKWFYDNKLQDQPPKNTILEELQSVLDKYDISISLVQDCDNNHIMLLESGSDETLGVYFEDRINKETIQEYIDACTIRDAEFEPSRQCDLHIVNYLGKDIPVPFTFKRGWLATDEDGEIYVYMEEPIVGLRSFEVNYTVNSLDLVNGIDYLYLGRMNFTAPYKKWKESKLFFDISEE